MKTPALLMLSALVALGHWLLLAPGPDMLTRLTSIGSTAAPTQAAPAAATPHAANAAATAPRAMQTRRIESAPLALSVVAIAPAETRRPTRPRPPSVEPRAAIEPTHEEPTPEPAASTAALEPDPLPDAALNPPEQPGGVAEANAADLTEPVEAPPPAAQLIANLQLPKTARLNYDITGQSRGLGYRASGLLDWQQDGKHYDARMVASLFFLGSRTLTSQGEVTADGLAPTRFADKARSEHAAHFQPDKGKITFSANTPDAPWQRGAQDRLSVFFQLAGMLAGQPERVTPGTQIPVYTAGTRSADTWAFLVDGPENLTLPAGDMATFKLTRQSRMAYDQTVEIWFAPALAYWPVRIKVTQRNGDFVDQQLASTP